MSSVSRVVLMIKLLRGTTLTEIRPKTFAQKIRHNYDPIPLKGLTS